MCQAVRHIFSFQKASSRLEAPTATVTVQTNEAVAQLKHLTTSTITN